MLTFRQKAFVDETRDDVRILEIARTLIRHDDLHPRVINSTYKLSCFPKTFVGIADVKLSPNSSL